MADNLNEGGTLASELGLLASRDYFPPRKATGARDGNLAENLKENTKHNKAAEKGQKDSQCTGLTLHSGRN